jgi:hypothetical protein
MTAYLTNLILFGWAFAAWDHFRRKQLNNNKRAGFGPKCNSFNRFAHSGQSRRTESKENQQDRKLTGLNPN